jgi:hypothetical protein
MRRALTFVVHVVWAVSMVTLGTWIGAAHGWVYHGWLGAIALGGESWSRSSEQSFRVDRWSLCRG